MKAKIIREWHTDEVKVWLYDNTLSGELCIYKVSEDGRLIGKTMSKGAILPEDWCMRLPPDAIKALVDASLPEFPPSDATARHLQDAITVRDRLLAIVEKT